jgi:hypothetical protein
MGTNLLPVGFRSVESLVAEWVLADSDARAAKRQASTMSEVQSFYDAMLPIARPAIEYLHAHALEELQPEGMRLLKLMLSLAEISTAVEWYGSPTVPDSFDFARFQLIASMPDTEPQS